MQPTTNTPPSFFYFDLGKVLVNFDIGRMLDQLGLATGATPQRLKEVIFDGGLQRQFESGRLAPEEFFDAVCRQTDTRPDWKAFETAAVDIFELNVRVTPIVASLRASGRRMGVLSNTCVSHWEHCRRRYRILDGLFDVMALSYEIGRLKPEPEIFHAAADLAGAPPEEIFFVDDILGHVEGARSVRFDAVPFTTPTSLALDLRRRGVVLSGY